MRILIDIGHPGHVHYFKNAIKYLKDNGHQVLIVAREKKIIFDLLQKLNLPYISRGKGANSMIGKFFYLLKADIQLLKISLKFKPDLFLNFTLPYSAHVSYLLRKPNIALNDTEHVDRINSKLTHPFCSCILTPVCYKNNLGKKQIRFNNVVEGLYLHEKLFHPNIKVKEYLNLKKNEEYVVIRFVSWNAHHDVGQSGLDFKTKIHLIKLLRQKFKIFISSEEELPEEFIQYKIDIPPEKMHDVLAFSTLFIGESATMASESTLLGTNAVYINSLPLMGYLKLELEAGLLKHFETSNGVIEYVNKLIADPELKCSSKEKSKIMQKNFINPTKFLVWFIENFPKSLKIMKENPNYQYKFK